MIPEIEIKKTESLENALKQMASGGLKPLAGGTDMVVDLREERKVDFNLLDISQVRELKKIHQRGDEVFIGTLATFTQVLESGLLKEKAPIVPLSVEKASCVQIRNRATIGGNICNASPAADSVPALVALDARAHLQSASGRRTLALDEFITGPYSTDLKEGELLTGVSFKPLPVNSSCAFYKLGRREALAISRMNIAIILKGDKSVIEEAVISPGSVMPSPVRIWSAEKILNGNKPSSELFEKAAGKVRKVMVENSGIRWSTEYKKPVIQTMVKRALTEAAVNLK